LFCFVLQIKEVWHSKPTFEMNGVNKKEQEKRRACFCFCLFVFFIKTLKNTQLSGSPAKSGPLDFATKNSFLLFFAGEKGLAHTYKKPINYFPILSFSFATSQN